MPVSNLCVVGLGWPCLPSNEWAAWVQALGSVAALAIAVAIPISIHRADRKRIDDEKRVRARSYALALLPALEGYASSVRQVKWRLRQEDAHLELYEISVLLDLPADLNGRILDIHEMGALAIRIQDALSAIPGLKALINDHEFFLRHGGTYHDHDGTEFDIPEPESLEPVIEQVDRDFNEAVESIRRLFHPQNTPDTQS